MPKKKVSKKSIDNSINTAFEKDQDDLMSTLESIKGLLEQSEGKLNAARESISIANTNTQNDTSALHELRNMDDEELIVPILDEIIEPELSSDSMQSLPEPDTIFTTVEAKPDDASSKPVAEELERIEITAKPDTTPDLSSLSQKNQIIATLDEFQIELEQSLRETLMKTMVSLEKDLKDRIGKKIDDIKSEIIK